MLLNVNVNGNKKLKNNENTRFMIWNLPAQATCPFATDQCKKACYAKKAERQYPQVLPCRNKNLAASLSDTFIDDMIETIETYLNRPSFKGKKIVFRIHESGDFYSAEYASKWVSIAYHFLNHKNLVFVAYTKSIKYLLKVGCGTDYFPSNLKILASVWDDTAADQLALIDNYNFKIYTAFDKLTLDDMIANGNYTKCECSDCATCGKCWDDQYKKIAVQIH